MIIIYILIAIFFGALWGYLVTQSWVSFFAAIVSLIGIIRMRNILVNIMGFGLQLLTSFVFGCFIILLFYIASLLQSGNTQMESWVFFVIGVLTIINYIPESFLKLSKVWKMSMNTEYLESMTLQREINRAFSEKKEDENNEIEKRNIENKTNEDNSEVF